MDWKIQAKELHDQGMSYQKIADRMGRTYNSVRNGIRRLPGYRGSPEQEPEKPQKIDVVQNVEPETLHVDWKGNRIVRFGLLSDTHVFVK